MRRLVAAIIRSRATGLLMVTDNRTLGHATQEISRKILASRGYMDILVRIFLYPEEANLALYIKDDATVRLVERLATERGLTKTDAVRIAVQAELSRAREEKPLRDRMAEWRKANPMPPPTGLKADKAFFDDLSGDEP
jgi:antitoxin VapB